jgi:hypothetical protein
MPAAERHRNGRFGGGAGPIVRRGVLQHPTIAMRRTSRCPSSGSRLVKSTRAAAGLTGPFDARGHLHLTYASQVKLAPSGAGVDELAGDPLPPPAARLAGQ